MRWVSGIRRKIAIVGKGEKKKDPELVKKIRNMFSRDNFYLSFGARRCTFSVFIAQIHMQT